MASLSPSILLVRETNKQIYRSTRLICHVAKGKGGGDWADAYTKAAELVAQLTLEEKVCLLPKPPFSVGRANNPQRIILPMESQQLRMVVLGTSQLSLDWDSLECAFRMPVMEFVLPILSTATPVVYMLERGKRHRS
jgi:hypothetical protein